MAKKRVIPKAPSRFSGSLEGLKSRLSENTERIKEMQTKATDKMSENPLQTAAISFCVGIVCGIGLKMLIDSKRK